jgi:hypothetical protein
VQGLPCTVNRYCAVQEVPEAWRFIAITRRVYHQTLHRASSIQSVLNLLLTKNSIFWDITPCSQLKVNRCFAGTCHLYLQGRRISQARKECEVCGKVACQLLHAGFLLGLILQSWQWRQHGLTEWTTWCYIAEATAMRTSNPTHCWCISCYINTIKLTTIKILLSSLVLTKHKIQNYN